MNPEQALQGNLEGPVCLDRANCRGNGKSALRRKIAYANSPIHSQTLGVVLIVKK